jgi:hypothetical protein
MDKYGKRRNKKGMEGTKPIIGRWNILGKVRSRRLDGWVDDLLHSSIHLNQSKREFGPIPFIHSMDSFCPLARKRMKKGGIFGSKIESKFAKKMEIDEEDSHNWQQAMAQLD